MKELIGVLLLALLFISVAAMWGADWWVTALRFSP